MKHKVIAVIPARGGSKGIPRKNIKPLCGKPLIAYTIEAALQSKYLDRTIVSTDDKKIADIARKLGAEVPFIRAKELAEDDVPLIPYVLRHAVEELERTENLNVDIVVMLQPTSPFRKARYIGRTSHHLMKRVGSMGREVDDVHKRNLRVLKSGTKKTKEK